MTLPLQPVPDPGTNQNFQEISKRFPLQSADIANSVKNLFLRLAISGDISVNFGSGEVTFAASATSNDTAVAHGLATTPSAVLVGSGGGFAVYFSAHTVGATNFSARGFSPGGAFSGNRPFYWIAIG